MKCVIRDSADGIILQRYIVPTSDWGFKRLFGTEANKDVLIGLLNKLIDDREVKDVKFLERDLLLPVGEGREMSFDVYCECQDGSRVIVEMQNYARPNFIDRSLVYTSASIVENYLYNRSKGYRVQKVYLIAITGDTLFKEVEGRPVRLAFCNKDSEKTQVLNDKILHIFIELPKFADDIGSLNPDSEFLDKFAVALKTMAESHERPEVMDDEMLVKLYRAADTKRYSEDDKDTYTSNVMNQLEYEATLWDFREEGLAEGLEKGLATGLAEGSEKRAREIAAKLKAQNIATDIIATCTGLTAEAVAAL
ncbi:MAG: Rpn family recombination-promoting nuclease/putative transposase [Bacteroidales bacterium]|nr:Rpn family recombination-promoting nuclease/putative transposase [Bacteroidales bacterium]MBR5703021.1 Rpn family recombination-promoting nuclease/putative transposase [Bacteroidales bacterium]